MDDVASAPTGPDHAPNISMIEAGIAALQKVGTASYKKGDKARAADEATVCAVYIAMADAKAFEEARASPKIHRQGSSHDA